MPGKKCTIRSAIPAVSALTCLLYAGAANADDCVGPDATCWGCFAQSIADCDFVFQDPDDAPLRNACALGAGIAYLACTTDSDNPAINQAWSDLIEDLQECEQMFSDPAAVQGCIDMVYQDFIDAIEAATGHTYEDPTTLNSITGMPINTFNDIVVSTETNRASTNYVTVEVGQTISIPNAGVASAYDARLNPDIDGVILLATYRTKLGTVTRIVDQDLDLSDGSPLSMDLDPAEFIHADQVLLSAIYLSHDAVPVFIESGVVVIPDSPISGDYNRDTTTDSLDMLEYIDGYGNSVRRTDMNENGDVESGDLNEFVDDYNAGS